MSVYKQNINNGKRKHDRFGSCENSKNDKFSVYTYGRNILGRSENMYISNVDDEYIEDDNNGNKQSDNIDNYQQQQVDNLCELWDRLGNEQQQQENVQGYIQIEKSNKNDRCQQQQMVVNNNNKQVVQLTQQQLMQCFGDIDDKDNVQQNNRMVKYNNQLSKQRQQDNNKNVIKINNKININNIQQNNRNMNKQQYDEDLMAIWGQDQQQNQQQMQQQIHQQSKSNQQQQKNNRYQLVNRQQRQLINKQQEIKQIRYINQDKYSWQQQQKKQQQQQNKLQSQLQQKQQKEQLFNNDNDSLQMELQDPNTIINQTNNKQNICNINNNKKQNNYNVQNDNNKQNNNIKETKQSHKQSNQQSNNIINNNNTINHLNHNNNLSIINQIILENNNKSMNKLIPNKHYLIYNHKLFSTSPFINNNYSYFGIYIHNTSLLDHNQKNQNQSTHYNHNKNIILNNQLTLQLKQNQHSQQSSSTPQIFYLYSFQTQQAYLELKPQKFHRDYYNFLSVKKTITHRPGQKIIKSLIQYNIDLCYKIRLCSTKQHIATMFYKVIKDGYLFDLRLYDEYEQCHSDPIALIQVKDGFANQCCYCDTNVFIQKKNAPNGSSSNNKSKDELSKKQSYIQKLKMILNIKNGKLTANMGINGIQSSPYNSCLQNQQNNKFVYLMGLLSQQQSKQGILQTQQNNKLNKNSKREQINNNENKNKKNNDNQINNKQQLNNNKNSNNIKQQTKQQQIKQQKKNNNKFIIKIGQGISPLLGLVIAAGRKIYIDSFQ